MSPSELTARLHEELPLTRAIQMSVASWDGKRVTLTAPLAPNINHTDTAFGGSISCMGILAGYALVYLLLQERNVSAKLLIQKSSTDFLRPIDSDLLAAADVPPQPAVDAFFDSLQSKRRGKLQLDSQILSRQVPAATHTGLYVAMLY